MRRSWWWMCFTASRFVGCGGTTLKSEATFPNLRGATYPSFPSASPSKRPLPTRLPTSEYVMAATSIDADSVAHHRVLEDVSASIAPSALPVLGVNATACNEGDTTKFEADGTLTCVPPAEVSLLETLPMTFIVVALTGAYTFYYMKKSYNFQIEALLSDMDSAAGQIAVITLVVVDLTLLGMSFQDPSMGTLTWFLFFGWFATAVYLAELIIRIFASHRLFTISLFFKDVGNIIDAFVVFLDVALSVVELAMKVGLPLGIVADFATQKSYVKPLKLVRMTRLKRLVVAAQKASHADIMEACETGNHNMLRVALMRGHSPHQRNPFKETPLHVAARRGHASLLETLLTQHSVGQQDLHARDKVGRTPLFHACYFRHREAVEMLLMHIHDVPSALQSRPWSGPQMNVSPEELMKKRHLYDIIEAAERTKAVIKAEKAAKQAKWDKEQGKLSKVEEHRLLGIQLNLKKDLTLILNAESNALKKAWAKWHEVIDIMNHGHYEDLCDIDFEILDKTILRKHLIAREVDMDGHESAGHRKLMKMLQQSISQERLEREAVKEKVGKNDGLKSGDSAPLDALSSLNAAEAEVKRQEQKKELMKAKVAADKLAAEEKAGRLRDAERRRQAYLKRYHWNSYEEYREEIARRREEAALNAAPTEELDDDAFGDFDDGFSEEEDDDGDEDEDEIEVLKLADHEGSLELTGSVELTGSIDLSYETNLLADNEAGTEVPESNHPSNASNLNVYDESLEGSASLQSSLELQPSLELFGSSSIDTQSLTMMKKKK